MTGAATRAIVANPGRQHSDQLAAALAGRNMLALFAHGSPVRDSLSGVLPPGTDRAMARYRMGIALANRLPGGRAVHVGAAHRVYYAFGRAVARMAARRDDWSVAISAENSALELFRVARARGAMTILDAASVHFAAQSPLPDPGLAARNARKAEEIALADHILTCSALARDSYIEAGVPAERVHVLTLGIEPPVAVESDVRTARTGPVRFLFVARSGFAKGADVLGQACAALTAAGTPFELHCAGGLTAEALPWLSPYATLHGELGAAELTALMAYCDVLLHPSRFDSFGLVVAEAMAAGLPVIASDRTGAKDLVVPGRTGEVVPTGDAAALAAAMTRFADDPARARAMAGDCRAAVAVLGWPQYRTAAADLVARLAAGQGG